MFDPHAHATMKSLVDVWWGAGKHQEPIDHTFMCESKNIIDSLILDQPIFLLKIVL